MGTGIFSRRLKIGLMMLFLQYFPWSLLCPVTCVALFDTEKFLSHVIYMNEWKNRADFTKQFRKYQKIVNIANNLHSNLSVWPHYSFILRNPFLISFPIIIVQLQSYSPYLNPLPDKGEAWFIRIVRTNVY